jgi:hypothetical protein
MPGKGSKDKLKEGTRNLLDKVGTAGDGFCVFLGAGASKAVGLPTMKELGDLLSQKISKIGEKELSKFLGEIINVLKSETGNGITIEKVLEMLYHVHFLMEKREGKISLRLGEIGDVNTQLLTSSIDFIKEIIWKECHLIDPLKLKTHQDFLECFMGEFGRIRKLNIFTTNWDFAVEMTCDELKFKCVDGFIGIFDAFEKFSVFDEPPGELFRTVYLHKLHGSLNWMLEGKDGGLRKKANWQEIDSCAPKRFMVFPIPSKTGEILGYPYADLISRFSDALKRLHPLLLVIGYNFTDTHITAKITTMLKDNERSNLFIVDPCLKLDEVSGALGINAEKDARVTLLQTDFTEFANILKELSTHE